MNEFKKANQLIIEYMETITRQTDSRNKKRHEFIDDIQDFMEYVVEKDLYGIGEYCNIYSRLSRSAGVDIAEFHLGLLDKDTRKEVSQGHIFYPIICGDSNIEYLYYELRKVINTLNMRIGVGRKVDCWDNTKRVDLDQEDFLYTQIYIPANYYDDYTKNKILELLSNFKVKCVPFFHKSISWTEKDEKALENFRIKSDAVNQYQKEAQEYKKNSPRTTWCPRIGSFAEEERDNKAMTRWSRWNLDEKDIPDV